MTHLKRRLGREYRTMMCMVEIYCRDHHPGERHRPCLRCLRFIEYAEQRLQKCPYGQRKPVCARCPVHCYKRAQREQARKIMRYAGPRMLVRHPWFAMAHIADKLRRVEHPMEIRRRKAGRTGTRVVGRKPR
ncbi:MAG: nitrous oxide-stimulated promoter family protein [Gammaproteobacteria bacterium]